jgi:hypothetical protein
MGRCCVECAVSELFLSLRLEGLRFIFPFSRCAMAMPSVSTLLLCEILEVSCRKHRHMLCTYLASARM